MFLFMPATHNSSRERLSTFTRTYHTIRPNSPNELTQLTTGRHENCNCLRHKLNFCAPAQVYLFSIKYGRDIITRLHTHTSCSGEKYISVIAPFAKRGGTDKPYHFSGAFHINDGGFERLLRIGHFFRYQGADKKHGLDRKSVV